MRSLMSPASRSCCFAVEYVTSSSSKKIFNRPDDGGSCSKMSSAFSTSCENLILAFPSLSHWRSSLSLGDLLISICPFFTEGIILFIPDFEFSFSDFISAMNSSSNGVRWNGLQSCHQLREQFSYKSAIAIRTRNHWIRFVRSSLQRPAIAPPLRSSFVDFRQCQT